MRLIDKTKAFWNKEAGNAKKIFVKLIFAVPFWIIVIGLVLIGFGIGRSYYLTDTRPDQYMAEAWQSGSDTSFRHMTVYAGGIRVAGDTSPVICAEGGKSLRLADITDIRQKLQTASATGNGNTNKNTTFHEDKLKGWEDCYSSTVMAKLEAVDVNEGLAEVTSSADVQLVAVGGNYKAFHPFRFLSGGFLPETPVDTNQIVINDVLAWKFYRSYDVVGNRIDINGEMFTVIGVVEEKNTKVAELAGEQQNRAFIYFGTLEKLYKNNSNDADNAGSDYSVTGNGYIDYGIQCYEAMLPELVKGVAVEDFKNALPSYSITNPQVYVVNNTGRFGLFRVFDTVFPLGETDRQRLGYEFPYWETAAQMTEERLFYDYVIIGFGIVLLLTGGAMFGLKFRANKSGASDETDNEDEDGLLEKGEQQLLLKA